MILLYAIFPLIMLFLLLMKKVDVKSIINAIFWGVISILITVVISTTILPLLGLEYSPNLDLSFSKDIGLFTFIIGLLSAALPEEISKFMCIKFTKQNDKNSILLNSIIIGVTFAFLENILYSTGYSNSIIITRILQPGHLFFQLLMAFFLIKALNYTGIKNKIFNVLAIMVPAICHTIFNTLNSIDIVSYVFYIIGILTYIFAIYCILKVSVQDRQYKINFFAIKLLVVIASIVFSFFMYSEDNSNTAVNDVQIIEEDNIELKVISQERVEINDGLFSGNYIKIKVELKNKNDSIYLVDSFHFHLVDNLNKNMNYLSISVFDDSLIEVLPGQTTSGYLYFTDNGYNYTYLIYDTGIMNKSHTYSFSIKS